MVGRRRAGKSYMCKEILKIITEKYDYHSIVLISDTASFEKNKTWGFVDKDMIYTSE